MVIASKGFLGQLERGSNQEGSIVEWKERETWKLWDWMSC